MLHRLVGRPVFADADGIVGHDENRPHTHQRRQPDRRAAIIRKHHEGAAIGDQPAMQRHAVHRRRHAVLADAVMDIASGEMARRDGLQPLGQRVVGGGQVGRSAHCAGDMAVDDIQHLFGAAAGAGIGLFGAEFRFQFDQCRAKVCRNRAGQRGVKGLCLCTGGVFALFPDGMGVAAPAADGAPGR